jgi:cytochrome b561
MFGFVPSIQTVALIGIVLFVLLSFQMALGMRWIKLEGRTHRKVHKWLAWAIYGIVAVHGAFGLIIAGIINFG